MPNKFASYNSFEEDADSAESMSSQRLNEGKKGAGELLGTLKLKACEGKLLRDTEAMGEMDPFIQIKYNSKTYRTRVLEEGGKEPKWNEEFEIPVYSNVKEL